MMPGYITMVGRVRCAPAEPWVSVVCHVAYDDAAEHQDIVERSFRDHLRLDVDEMKQSHAGHFTEPHNVARAILLYHYFRLIHTLFEEDRFEYSGPQFLPDGAPTSQGPGFRVWIDNATQPTTARGQS